MCYAPVPILPIGRDICAIICRGSALPSSQGVLQSRTASCPYPSLLQGRALGISALCYTGPYLLARVPAALQISLGVFPKWLGRTTVSGNVINVGSAESSHFPQDPIELSLNVLNGIDVSHHGHVPEWPIAESITAIVDAIRLEYISPDLPQTTDEFSVLFHTFAENPGTWLALDRIHNDGKLADQVQVNNVAWAYDQDEYKEICNVISSLPFFDQDYYNIRGQSESSEANYLIISSTNPDIPTLTIELQPPHAMDKTPPAGYRYRTWKFGEQPGHALARTTPGNEAKGAVTWKDVKDWPLYDALMVVDEENLPPLNVIMSSELAYKVIRVVLATGCLTLRQLYRFWPANYTTTGSPVIAI